MTSRTNARGVTAFYTYDDNDNLTGITYSDGTPDVTLEYDATNRLVQRLDGLGSTAYTYDSDSRLTGVDGPWPDDTLTFQYNALGLRNSVKPQGSRSVGYTYDRLNRLAQVQMGSLTYSYGYPADQPPSDKLKPARRECHHLPVRPFEPAHRDFE